MSEYHPEQDDYIAYSDHEMFIVWNGSAQFTIYERKKLGSETLDRFVNFDVEDHDHAQEIAYDWVEEFQRSADD